ncbi:RagB/SusD family nutrient uptake outer membrane protein [Sinomicrobium weinanense]|uniref:SusD/RagB family nutrient-binding outer membrane lipoprotein n=1 Tax=Sinomicrobium weinanense TaxID=2842200 RepID=A0A926JT74_9FLAO|nr:RagB/SusD family nutrient uptake outer membrane protein [Sinomicrobium weinanense]MBC9796874.1 SusD/RagB family nutrient-binding outer membrane lipoprotein [Sinomicrobium weinanense]MBU3123875.1 SusD/RagB family nutrient-binding outer membrane lipoprotein [Sinomicrobium weinanense]
MKNTITYILVSVLAIGLTNCTGDFEDKNTDPHGISDESLKQKFNNIGTKFAPMFSNVIRAEPAPNFQLQHNLNADVFSGYMASPTPFAGNINNQTYSLVSGWNQFIWSDAYDVDDGGGVMPYARGVHEQVELSEGKNIIMYTYLSDIIKVMAMHRISDVFGPIRYTKFDDYGTTGEYDSQEVAYKAFFADLEKAIDSLKEFEGEPQFEAFDQSFFRGDVAKWRTFANTLRLRLAIRVSKVDPALAKTEGEKSLSSDAGLLENEDMLIDMQGFVHPLWTISNDWGDIRMSAEMESVLKGFNDGRVEKYFKPAIGGGIEGMYKGVRMGVDIEAKSQYLEHSSLGEYLKNQAFKVWMTSAEVYFLKAEAALRGWDGAGDAKENYENGVRASFAQHGVAGVDEYLADATSTPADFVDAINPENNYEYPGDVTIAYNSGGSKEEQLEQIITQKWIAMYPDGQEAWSEFRRTGYPRVFPVVINNSGGTIDTEVQIRRINFVDSEKNTNNANVEKAINYLSGPDTGGTRLWWDTGGPNF